jgi:hypothetical protein
VSLFATRPTVANSVISWGAWGGQGQREFRVGAGSTWNPGKRMLRARGAALASGASSGAQAVCLITSRRHGVRHPELRLCRVN